MTADNQEKFQQQFQAGKQALERGQYRQSIKHLEAAQNLIMPSSRRAEEAKIWLVTAYQAANQIDSAIALAQELVSHPNLQTRDQAQRILYIMTAPKLERPKEWMSEIPDLGDADKGASRYVSAKKKAPAKPKELELEDLEPVPTEVKDQDFLWFSLVLVAVIVGSLFWFGSA
ncbi:MAG: outer membrane protein assembly factor BamD [Cyanobacteria bacterium J06600_6]